MVARGVLVPLFPRPAPRRRGATTVAGWLVAALAAGVMLLRPPGGSPWDWLYAEDGAIFVSAAADGHGVRALLEPYAGYGHLLPRLVAALSALLPLRDAALVCAAAAAVAVGLLGAVLVHALAGWVPSLGVRAALGLAPALLPAARFELLDNIANLHWYLFATCFAVLLWRPRGLAGAGVAAGVALLTTGSDPLAVTLTVLVAARLLALPLREQAVVAGFVAGGGLQLAVVLRGHRAVAAGPDGATDLVRSWLVRVPLQLAGPTTGTEAFRAVGWVAPVLATGVLLLALAPLLPRPGGALLVAAALFVGGAAFGLSEGTSWSPAMLPRGRSVSFLEGSRYAFLPLMLLLFAAAAALPPAAGGQGSHQRRRALLLSTPAVLVLVVAAIGAARDFRGDGTRVSGVRWRSGLDAAASACRWSGLPAVDVKTTPAGFGARLPCAQVLAAAHPPRRAAAGPPP